MEVQTEVLPIDYAQALTKLVAKMPTSQVAQVYNFASFLQARQARPIYVAPQFVLDDDDDDDWLNDSEEELEAEDAMWDAALSRHHEKFTALAEASLA